MLINPAHASNGKGNVDWGFVARPHDGIERRRRRSRFVPLPNPTHSDSDGNLTDYV